MSDLPEPDRVEGAPHPRETCVLFGQDHARDDFLSAFNGGRLHHGWLISGPQGVGKATLAWQIARFLLATPDDDGGLFGAPEKPTNLDIDPEHPVARRMLAGSESGLFVLRRPYDEKSGKLKSQITIDEVRKLKGFFAMSATDGGRRLVIVDAADELNISAANALLKVLEEPPEGAVLLLVSHQPSRLLPTIRSRCRELRLSTLSSDDMALAMKATEDMEATTPALAELAAGSVGEAIRIQNLDGLQLYHDLVVLYQTMPAMNRQQALALAEKAAARGKEAQLALMLHLNDVLLARLARTGALGHPPKTEISEGEAALLQRLSPTPQKGRDWANIAQEISARIQHGRAVNLDPAALVLDTLFKAQKTAAG